MPATLNRPRLRPGLAAAPDSSDRGYVFVWDQLRLANRPQRLTLLEFQWLQMCNGERTPRDIQAESIRQLDGQILPLEWITALIERMDQALFLDGPRFREILASPVREPSCIGCYEADPAALRQQVTKMFTCTKGPGLPKDGKPRGGLRAALVPHIDYQRGGPTFAWGFKEVFECTEALLFVIIGTSHYSPHRYTLTRKNFKTPLGIIATDQTYIDRLSAHYGDGLFDDQMAHLPEHSIELEVVFLQYFYEGKRPIRIVPLVVGSFHDCVEENESPKVRADIRRMVEAIRHVETLTKEPICYIVSGDLAHIGPKFGDTQPVEASTLTESKAQDQAILGQTETADPEGYFQVIAEERDRRRICGLPPTYTLLEAIRPSRGKVLHYDQYVHPQGYESVSFASTAFYE